VFGKNERIVDLSEPCQAFEHNNSLESEGHDDQVVRDRDDDNQTEGRGWSKLDIDVVLEQYPSQACPWHEDPKHCPYHQKSHRRPSMSRNSCEYWHAS